MNQELKTTVSIVCLLAVCLLCFSIARAQTCEETCQTNVFDVCADQADVDKSSCDSQAVAARDQCRAMAGGGVIGCYIGCEVSTPPPGGSLQACYQMCANMEDEAFVVCNQAYDSDIAQCEGTHASALVACSVAYDNCILACP